jgi:hypothetical protein
VKRRSCAGKLACKIRQALSHVTRTLAADVFGLALAPSFSRAICSIPSFENSEICRERLSLSCRQKYQQNGRLPLISGMRPGDAHDVGS